MNAALASAGVIAVAVGAAHSVLGERYIVRRLLRRDLPRLFGSDDFTKRTIRFAWHLTTVAWCGIGVALIAVGGGSGLGTALRIIAIAFAVSAAIALGFSRGRHLSWIAFGAIAAATWAGAP